MNIYIITEAEIVTRTYRVEALSQQEAREKWCNFDREVLHADQTTRQCYDREIILIEDAVIDHGGA